MLMAENPSTGPMPLADDRQQGVHPVTAYRLLGEGELPVSARHAGRLILVDAAAAPSGSAAVYVGVSCADQRARPGGQVARVTAQAAGEGFAVGRMVAEVGSALNGKRGRFLALLRDGPFPGNVGPCCHDGHMSSISGGAGAGW